jgi:DNA-binding NtrC family response regulator
MGTDPGTKTVTAADAPIRGGDRDGLALVWVFPLPGAPAISLDRGARAAAELTIGRDAACDIRLDGGDVSRRHAALRWTGPGVGASLHDLGSRNGIRINGRVVAQGALAAGDVVRVGGWIGVVTAQLGALAEIASGLYGGAALAKAIAPLRLAAPSDLPIVLEGETGTGKEVVSRAVHAWSGRRGPFAAVNCAALPESLAEGELFGYRKGAFTGADKASPGVFRSAEAGTLLLDEVSDLSLAVQAKLLRVLEQREVQPLGETRPVPIDVRIVVAGQASLLDASRAGRFRPDLLARLEGMTVRLPPLRDRREDVAPLFSQLLRSIGGAGPVPAVEGELVERLCLYDWPFNVRELVQLVRRLLVLRASETTLRAEDLPDRIGQQVASARAEAGAGGGEAPAPPANAPAPGSARPLRTGRVPPAELPDVPALVAALRAAGGNVTRAAALLGITRQRAYRLMDSNAVDLDALRKPDDDPEA